MSGNILGGGLVRRFIGRYLVGLEIENQSNPSILLNKDRALK